MNRNIAGSCLFGRRRSKQNESEKSGQRRNNIHTTTASLCPKCPAKVFTQWSFSTSQTHNLRSRPALASSFPSPLNANDSTSSVWPLTSGSGRALPFPFLSVFGGRTL